MSEQQRLFQMLCDERDVAQVAAQNLVDHDNPAWTQLRAIARRRAEHANMAFLIIYLSQLDGSMGVVTRPTDPGQEVTTRPGAAPVTVRNPWRFTHRKNAEAWMKVNAHADVRYLVVEAIADQTDVAEFNADRPITVAEAKEFLGSLDYADYSEAKVWSNGPSQIPYAVFDQLTTWREFLVLLDLMV